MLKSFENYFSYAAVELFEGGIARQISPQHDRIDKVPHHAAELGALTARARRADKQVVLA